MDIISDNLKILRPLYGGLYVKYTETSRHWNFVLEQEVEIKTDLELLDAALKGDVDSFGELADRYYTAIVALAHSRIGDRHLAEDIAQESFAKACFKLNSLRDKSKFASWLGTICRNICMDTLRKSNKYEENDLSMIAAEQHRQKSEDNEQIKQIISGLPDKMREIIYLKFYDGMTYEKISHVLGISGQAINGRLRRAKKLIEKKLKS